MKVKALAKSIFLKLRDRRDLWIQDGAALWRLADKLLLQGRNDEAMDIYRRLAARPIKSPADALLSALAEHRLHNSERAADLLEAAVAKYPSAEDLREHLVRICLEQGQINRLVHVAAAEAKDESQVCESLFALYPDPKVQIKLIDYCLGVGDAVLAERKIKQAQAQFSSAEALWQLSDLLLKHRRTVDAEAIYESLSRRPPDSVENVLYAALSEYRLERPAKAAEVLEAGIRAHPSAEQLLDHYVRICVETGQVDRAMSLVAPNAKTRVDACNAIFERYSDFEIRLNLISYCIDNDFLEFADQKLELVRSYSKDSVALWRIADLLWRRGQRSEAEKIYRGLSEHSLETPLDYFYASLAFLRLGNIEKCLKTSEQGLCKYPKSDELKSLYAQTCAELLAYDRYLHFFEKDHFAGSRPVVSRFDFYRAASGRSPIDFIANLNDLELQFDSDEFSRLKSDFFVQLRGCSLSAEMAKSLLFLSKYLDVKGDFSAKLFEVLQDAHRGSDGQATPEGQTLRILFDLTPPIIPQEAIEREKVLREFADAANSMSEHVGVLDNPIVDMSIHWAPWQVIFSWVAPRLYGPAMSAFENFAFKTWPRLNFTAPHVHEAVASSAIEKRKLRIGFNVHDSMPMMSGFLNHMDAGDFETVFLRPGKAGQSAEAKKWVARADRVVEYSDTDTYAAMEVIAEQQLDIIVSGPAMASTFFPMMARLAPLQLVLLEPNWTDGLTNADYYVSWQKAEPENPSEFYKTAVSFLENPPYWIEKPLLNARWPITEEERTGTRTRLLSCGPESRIYLCANTPPKIHPEMDQMFYDLLERDKDGILVFLRGDFTPAKTLKFRLRERLGKLYERVIFLPTLSRDDAHFLLQSVDCCLDSYPVCGMSSSFDGCMLGVPIVTLPFDMPFGRWTAAIYEYLDVSGLTAKDSRDYVDIAFKLASDRDWRNRLAIEIREKSSRYVENMAASKEFQDFLIHAWERKVSGAPPTNWLGGQWR